jgi:hypothetical protein
MICRIKLPAQHVWHAIRRLLQKLKRQLHPTKTRLMAMALEGFDCRGLHFDKLGATHTVVSRVVQDVWISRSRCCCRRCS